jgi:hypothetical protein
MPIAVSPLSPLARATMQSQVACPASRILSE